MGSILQETKEMLGLNTGDESFDPELILHINSVLADLNQLGVGIDSGLTITNGDTQWADFMGSSPKLNAARQYMYLKVKMLFDPPQTGYLLTSWEKLIEEEAWRLSVHADTPTSSVASGKASLEGSLGDVHSIRVIDPPGGETLIAPGGSYEAEFVPRPSRRRPSPSPRKVDLDLSELGDGALILPVVIEDGKYYVRSLSPRRTLMTLEVTAV